MDQARKNRGMIGALIIINVFLILFLIFNIFWKYKASMGVGVPKINLELNGVSLSEINGGDKNTKYDDNKLVLEIDGEKIEFDGIELKGRGNMSWMMDKKSYRIKFPKKINFLSQQKTKKIVLIPNGLDDVFLRNDLAYFIARMVDENYPMKGDFVDLSVDGEYVGLYYLIQPIDINKSSVDLRNSDGILAELDNAYCFEEESWYMTKNAHDCIVIKDVVEDGENTKESIVSFWNNYEAFERAVIKGDFEKAFSYADLDSWAGYYLVGEFASNLDMAVTSLKIYQDGLGDKIRAVLAWDFDWAFGNKNWDDLQDSQVLMARYRMNFEEKTDYKAKGGDCRFKLEEGSDEARELLSSTICYLADMPEFMERVAELYRNKLQNKRQKIFDYIRERAAIIRDSAIRDNEKWGKRNFDEEVDYLIRWVDERFNYFNQIFGDAFVNIDDRINEV